MRDLTEEELKLAPEWATHYSVIHGCKILFESDLKCCLYENKTGLTHSIECNGVSPSSRPIIGFCFVKHSFSDDEVRFAKVSRNKSHVTITLSESAFGTVRYNKSDAIAIAKALGVTGEDLK